MRRLVLAILGIAVLAGAGLLFILFRTPEPARVPTAAPTQTAPSPVPPPAAAVPPATSPATRAVPALMQFRADGATAHSYDAGCEVTLHLRNLSGQVLSASGIVDAEGGGWTLGTAPFIFQYLDPNEERPAQVSLPNCGAARTPGILVVRSISICKFGNQYAGNCLEMAEAPAQPGPGATEVRITPR